MALSLNGTTGISGINGSAGTPALQGGDADTGIFFGTDTASIATAGANRLHVTSTGLIGVGTSSPAGGFHVDAASGVDGPVFDSGGAEENTSVCIATLQCRSACTAVDAGDASCAVK